MSKIGKKPIVIPTGVEVTIDGPSLTVKGPKGELKRDFISTVTFEIQDSKLLVKEKDSAMWGLSRALAANMVTGVSEGFQKILDFNGVGYKAQVKGNDIELNLGFTNPIIVQALPGVTFKVEKNSITVEGSNRESVGHIAAKIRSFRPPEPYKGSGIKYRDEVIQRKAGKKAAGTTTA
ncbi:MAG: 50S ribosomal protein L6 [Patescibacteria group bacterium]